MSAGDGPDDVRFMRRALELARRGWGHTAPNPMVGAVIVREGEIVGEGYHARYGDEHAEAAALRAAGDRASGATVYVTLEPCTHTGQTPPCAERPDSRRSPAGGGGDPGSASRRTRRGRGAGCRGDRDDRGTWSARPPVN